MSAVGTGGGAADVIYEGSSHEMATIANGVTAGSGSHALVAPRPDLMKSLYVKPLQFVVTHNQVAIRKDPSTKASHAGVLQKGKEVEGFLQGKWLKLQHMQNGWVLTDGSCLNLGHLLEHSHCEIEVVRTFAEAVLLRWERVPGIAVEYCVEWARKDSRDDPKIAMDRETMTLVRVHELPPDEMLLFRVTARILTSRREDGGEVFATLVGKWEEGETERPVEEVEEHNLCCDPLANLRGRCMDCKCRGFVIAESHESGPKHSLETVMCRRCGCSCIRHVIVGEYFYKRPTGTPGAQPQAQASSKLALPDQNPQEAAALTDIAEKTDKTWEPKDAGDKDKVQFVLDRIAEARTLYETLGLAASAEDKDIRHAFRQISLTIHPDKVSTREDTELVAQAEGAFKIISAAYEVLSDDGKRRGYDRTIITTGWRLARSNGSRADLKGTSFLKRFLGKGGFGWDLKAKPPGDWEDQGNGYYCRSNNVRITVRHAISGEEYESAFERGTQLVALKKRIVKELKRGPENRIELASLDGTDLKDSYRLSQSETLVLVGIPLGAPKKVEVCLSHADTGARLRMKVLDTSTIAELRKEVSERLNVSQNLVRLGIRSNNHERFKDFNDDELLNGREQMLVLGVTIVVKLTIAEAVELQTELIEAYGQEWFQKRLDELLQYYPPPDSFLDKNFKSAFSELTQRAQRDTLVKHGFDGPNGVYTMMSSFSEVGREPEVMRLSSEIDSKLRVTYGCVIPSVIEVRLDPAPEDAVLVEDTSENEEGEGELDIAIVVDRVFAEWPTRLTVSRGTTVLELKELLAAEDPTKRTKAKDIGLGISPATEEDVVLPLADSTRLCETHLQLDICEPVDPVTEAVEDAPAIAIPAQDDKENEQVSKRRLTLVVLSSSTIKMLREEVGKKLEVDASAVKLVTVTRSSKTTVATAVPYDDDEHIGRRRRFSVLGVTLPIWEPKPPTKPKPPLPPLPPPKVEPKPVTAPTESNSAHLPSPPGDEKRVAPDGCAYTMAEFKAFYGGLTQWNEAKWNDAKWNEAKRNETIRPGADSCAPSQPFAPLSRTPAPEWPKSSAPKQALDHELPKPSIPNFSPVAPSSSGAVVVREEEAKAKPPPAPPPEPPTDVEVTVRHVGSGDSLGLRMMSTSTMAQVRRALGRKIRRPEVLERGRLAHEESEGCYASYRDDECLGKKELLFLLNAPITENPEADSVQDEDYREAERRRQGLPSKADTVAKPLSEEIDVQVRSVNLGHCVTLSVPRTATVKQVKVLLANFVGRPDAPELLGCKLLRRDGNGTGYTSFKEDDEPIAGCTRLFVMNTDISPETGSEAELALQPMLKPKPKVKAKAKLPPPLPAPGEPDHEPEPVLVTISHATASAKNPPVEVQVMDDVSIGAVKAALAAKLSRPDVAKKGRFVQKKGGASFSGVRDDEALGTRRELLFMGADLK